MSNGEIGAIIFLLAIVGLAFCFAGWQQKKINADTRQREDAQDESITQIESKIKQLAKDVLGDDDKPIHVLLDNLYDETINKYLQVRNSYCQSNNIYTTCDSYSSTLGLCGVSNTTFFYNLDANTTSVNSLFNMSNVGEIHTELKDYAKMERAKNGGILIYDYSKEIESRIYKLRHVYGICKSVHESLALRCQSIDLASIQQFSIEGDVHYISNVSGGGVNLRGAVAGAALGGGAGAVIGSHIGTETTTDIEKRDSRKICLLYTENNTLYNLEIRSRNVDKTIEALRTLIPSKEASVVLINNVSMNTTNSSTADEIKKYKDLLDCGAITQDEFNAKKRQLLGL